MLSVKNRSGQSPVRGIYRDEKKKKNSFIYYLLLYLLIPLSPLNYYFKFLFIVRQ